MKPFYFSIPFLSEQVAKDFDANCRMLRHTLASCCQQTDPSGVRVVVCHHEMPLQIKQEFPEALFLEAPLGPPTRGGSKEAWRLDKRLKIREITLRLKQEGGGHLMMTDADDMVSRDVVRQVRAYGEMSTVLFSSGYIFNLYRKTFINVPEDHGQPLYSACGTSMALYLSAADIPAHINDFSRQVFFNRLSGHKLWASDLRSEKRQFEISGIPSVIYTKGHGSNLTSHRDDGTFSGALLKGGENSLSKAISDFRDENFNVSHLL